MTIADDIKELKRTLIVACDLANRSMLKAHALTALDRIKDHLADQEAYAIACLTNVGIDTHCGACMQIAHTGSTLAAHTCSESRDTEPAPPISERQGLGEQSRLM